MNKREILGISVLVVGLFTIGIGIQDVWAPDNDKPEKLVTKGDGIAEDAEAQELEAERVARMAADSEAQAIPPWVGTTMRYYLDGQISEGEILNAFNFLFSKNIMHLSPEAAQEVRDLKDENKRLEAQVVQYRESDFDFVNRVQEPESAESPDEFGRIKVKFPSENANNEDIANFIAEIYAEKITRTQSSDTIWIPVIEDEVLVSFEKGDPDRPIIIGRVYHSESTPSYTLADGKLITASKATLDRLGNVILAGGHGDDTSDNAELYTKIDRLEAELIQCQEELDPIDYAKCVAGCGEDNINNLAFCTSLGNVEATTGCISGAANAHNLCLQKCNIPDEPSSPPSTPP